MTPKKTNSLSGYHSLDDPIFYIIKNSVLISIPLVGLYIFLTVVITSNPDFYFSLFEYFFRDYNSYEKFITSNLEVDKYAWPNRLLFICYFSIYAGLWTTYFKSKVSSDIKTEDSRLKIQSLRRLLGVSSCQWNNKTSSLLLENHKQKAQIGMTAISILIAGSVIIISLVSGSLPLVGSNMLWDYSILWVSLIASVTSFACFLMCIDSMDTIFNKFDDNQTEEVLIHYFYQITSNPRYAGNASMLLSVLLFLSYYSITLGSISIMLVLYINYNLWFPDLPDSDSQSKRFKRIPLVTLLMVILVLIVKIYSVLNYA